MNRIFFILFSLLLLQSCFVDQTIYGDINITQSFDLKVTNYRINRGTYILNNKYTIWSSNPLISNHNLPKWLLDKKKRNSKFTLSDVFPPPFNLYKKENDSFFYVVKNSDTLKFRILENF